MNIKYLASQLTAYEMDGYIDFKGYVKDVIQEQMYELDHDKLVDEYNKYCVLNSYDCYLDNDTEMLETYFSTMLEAVRATQYGEYTYNHPYVRFNGYGNLDSFQSYEVEEDIINDNGFIDYIFDLSEELSFIDIEELLEHKEEILKEAYNLVRQGY